MGCDLSPLCQPNLARNKPSRCGPWAGTTAQHPNWPKHINLYHPFSQTLAPPLPLIHPASAATPSSEVAPCSVPPPTGFVGLSVGSMVWPPWRGRGGVLGATLGELRAQQTHRSDLWRQPPPPRPHQPDVRRRLPSSGHRLAQPKLPIVSVRLEKVASG